MAAIEKRSLLFSNKDLINMTVPVMLSSLLSIVAGMVDSAMVSSSGVAAMSAVSLVDAINSLFIMIFFGMTSGGGVIMSQYIGHRDYKQAKATANQVVYIMAIIATVVMALLLCFMEPVLKLVYGDLETDLFDNCKIYFFWTLWGYPFYAVGESSLQVLRSMGQNRQGAACGISSNVLNVIGNAVLIYGFGLGVAGAAISTTLSRIAYAAMGIWMGSNKNLPAHFEKLLKFRLDFPIIRRIVRIGSASSLEFGMFYGGRILITGLIATFGTIMITAHSVAFTMNNVGWSLVGAFGTALMPVIGQCIGADEKEQAGYYMKKMTGAGIIATAVLFGTTLLLRNQLVKLYDFEPDVLQICAYYTGVLSLVSILSVYSWAFVPVSGFRAAGDVRYATVLVIGTMFAFRVALAYVLDAVFPNLGLMCIYIGMGADFVVRSVMNVIRYRSGKWLYKRVI